MSIADLGYPNPYAINVGSVTSDSVTTGPITCTTVHATGAVSAASVSAGTITSTLSIVGDDIHCTTAEVDFALNCGSIGTGVINATGITSTSETTGPLVATSVAAPLVSGDAVVANTQITFPSLIASPLTILDSGAEVTATEDYSGAIVQVGAGILRYRKLGQWVQLSFTQTAAFGFATVTGIITLSTTLPVGFRPAIKQGLAVGVRSNATSVLGLFTIQPTGVMSFSPINGNFVQPFLAGLTGGVSATYATV